VRLCASAAAGLLVTLALAACGVGTKHSSSSATKPGAASTQTTSSGSTGTGTSASGTGTSESDAGTVTTGATTATSQTTTTSGSGHRRGKKGTNDLPAAPAGLTQTAGYGTYERCQGTCTGSVPTALRRPLDVPTDAGGPCPITVNANGPVSPHVLDAGVGFRSVNASQWLIAEVTWTVSGSYTGPLLIRGAMLGGGGALGFGTAMVPYDELQLLDPGQGAPRVASGGRAWITYSRVRSGGCYAYQVDGSGFSEVVVFRAVG
jgi:hypothetical protein